MADNSGGLGAMGVIVGALVVVVLGLAVLFFSGNLGGNSSTVKVEVPKVTTGANK